MADPTLVNGQITDAVTQANVKVLGDAPAMALGTVYQVLAQATGLSMQNAVNAQQQMNVLNQAVTTQGVSLLYSLDSDIVGIEHDLDDDDFGEEEDDKPAGGA
jgi:Killing trait